MIKKKNKDQIRMIQKSGQIAKFTLKQLLNAITPGVSSFELEKIANRLIIARGAKPSFLGYRGYKFATCISINDEVVHGLPSERRIKDGDIVSIDVGVNYKGYFSDTAATIIVGHTNEETEKLVFNTQKSLMDSISIVKPGIRVGEIENKTGEVLRKNKLKPILALSGHGVGLAVHEEPSIRSDGKIDSGEILEEGMVIAIEPMATLGSGEVFTDSDGWTIKTTDGKPAAHFEHTVVITKNGHKLLTA